MVVARMARLLDQQQVDKAGRWLVVDPVFMELLADEDSRIINADFGESGGLRNGLAVINFHGFRVYSSSNLPSVGTGPGTTGSANQNANYGVIVAGHDSAVATAEAAAVATAGKCCCNRTYACCSSRRHFSAAAEHSFYFFPFY